MLVSGSSRSCSVEKDEQDLRGIPGQTELINSITLELPEWASRAELPQQCILTTVQWQRDKREVTSQVQGQVSTGNSANISWGLGTAQLHFSPATTAGWVEMRCPGPRVQCGRESQKVPGEVSQKRYTRLVPSEHWHRDPLYFYFCF